MRLFRVVLINATVFYTLMLIANCVGALQGKDNKPAIHIDADSPYHDPLWKIPSCPSIKPTVNLCKGFIDAAFYDGVAIGLKFQAEEIRNKQ